MGSGHTEEQEPDFYQMLLQRCGKQGVTIAEKQLTLHFINVNWAYYLSAMEDKRSGIHLMLVGEKSPLDEYQIFDASAFNEMIFDIKNDVVEYMKKCVIRVTSCSKYSIFK